MWKEVKKKSSTKVTDINGNFCQSKEIHIVTEIMNLFIAELFPVLFKSFKNIEFPF